MVGKTTQKDHLKEKPTFTSMLGIEQAKAKLQSLYSKALSQLTILDDSAIFLREIAQVIISRQN